MVGGSIALRFGATWLVAAASSVAESVGISPLVVGLTAVVRPMTVDPAVFHGVAWLVALTAIATGLLATGGRVTRSEGARLVGIGASYWIATWTDRRQCFHGGNTDVSETL
ncbi:hypothetical protein [Natronorubrum sp. FCH18a]|uniref:hypothetical protein n=1 Tax=Natronorubrum sp. FCH18a TaxID=3447018 RepID=UPI003F50FF8D